MVGPDEIGPYCVSLGVCSSTPEASSTVTNWPSRPQLENAAIKHLCDGSDVTTIFIGKTLEHRASETFEGISFEIIPDYLSAGSNLRPDPELTTPTSDTAYLRHTSGTSSGLPKPIVQKHWGAVGVLPRLPGYENVASFSTTPLYHGGLADCFRAWASAAMIWFFPEGVVPVTDTNVIKALQYARTNSPKPIRVAYFTSVPYVLQNVAGDPEGLRLLQTMELVGVGGAALAPSVGDELVRQGVKLVSRMGSAECGFLMSSHRDYDNDKDWQYLRPVIDEKLLSFEARDGGLFELVAKPEWPLRAKQNREDGSYATSDLFQPHEAIANAWRYHSRSDAQITLGNGKKFDPAPLEGAIGASTKQLEDIFVFGTGRDYAGALLFPVSETLSNHDVLDTVWPIIEQINKDSQSHARLTRSALVVVPKVDGKTALEKSSKGTVMRRQAEERYAGLIESVYSIPQSETSSTRSLREDEIRDIVADKFAQVLGREVSPSEDLFRQGVDSIACIQIRKLVEASLLPAGAGSLPLNVIYEQGTIGKLAAYISSARQGGNSTQKSKNDHTEDSDLDLMRGMVETYGNFSSVVLPQAKLKEQARIVVLTGATGALGAHLLNTLREDSNIHKIYCLIRAQSPFAAHERVSKGLWKRNMSGLLDSSSYPDFDSKIVCLPYNLFDADLGLSADVEKRLTQECDLFIHAAWTVNFSLRLSSFEDHIQGLHNVLKLALSAGSRFVFVSSTASVGASSPPHIAESPSSNPSDASPLGYSRSKWVAEQTCIAAERYAIGARRDKETHALPGVLVVRVGQLCGNAAGVWNASEAYPLMLSSAKIIGCLPDLQGESLNWLPVDQAAQAVLDITSGVRNKDSATAPPHDMVIYHVLNPYKQPKWHDMLQWLIDGGNGVDFEIVQPAMWMSRLEAALNGTAAGHPSQKLLGFWQQKYGGRPASDNRTRNASKKPVRFETSTTASMSQTIANVQPLNSSQVLKMWEWICSNVGAEPR